MSDYVPTIEQVEEALAFAYGYGLGGLPECPDDDVPVEVVRRWLAEVERAAAEKAWDRCVGEMPLDTDWKNYYVDNNPYRKEGFGSSGT